MGLKMTAFGQWEYSCDHEATVKAYLATEFGGAESCKCNGCRNFIAVRDKVLPDEFLALLHPLGIEHAKDGEVYHLAQTAPGEHLYGGWFHFAGQLDKTGDFPAVEITDDFKVWMCSTSAPPIDALKNTPRVQLEFQIGKVPWILNEPELL